MILQREDAIDESVLIEDYAGGVRNAVVATVNLDRVVARCPGVGPALAHEIWQFNVAKIVGRFLQGGFKCCKVGVDVGVWYTVVDCVHDPNCDVPGNINMGS